MHLIYHLKIHIQFAPFLFCTLEILADLRRGKSEYAGSIFPKRGNQGAGKETDDDKNEHVTIPPTGGAKKMPPAPTTERDLLMSLNSSRYKNIINKWVKTLLTGECNSTYGEIVTQELNKVTVSGGKLYNPEYKVISIDDAVKSELPTIYAFYILLIQY